MKTSKKLILIKKKRRTRNKENELAICKGLESLALLFNLGCKHSRSLPPHPPDEHHLQNSGDVEYKMGSVWLRLDFPIPVQPSEDDDIHYKRKNTLVRVLRAGLTKKNPHSRQKQSNIINNTDIRLRRVRLLNWKRSFVWRFRKDGQRCGVCVRLRRGRRWVMRAGRRHRRR